MYTNVIINKVRKGYYTVVADSARFGPAQIVFEGSTKAQCKKFIERAEKQQTYTPNMTTYYVTMTDKVLSNWGKAEGKISKYVIECESYAEADTVYRNAQSRSDMKHVNITRKKPYYSPSTHHVSFANSETASNWFKPDYFKGGN